MICIEPMKNNIQISFLMFYSHHTTLCLYTIPYTTGGDDALPAHFESVAAILPPGSIAEEVRVFILYCSACIDFTVFFHSQTLMCFFV